MKKSSQHVGEDKHLPEFLKDFHDQKDVFKIMYNLWGEEIEEKTGIKWVNAHILTIDYFLWLMGLCGYKLQKDRSKNVEFYDINDEIREIKKKKIEIIKQGLNSNG